VSFSTRTLLHEVKMCCAVLEESAGKGFLWPTDIYHFYYKLCSLDIEIPIVEMKAVQPNYLFWLSSVEGLFLYTLTFKMSSK
jgi:hypothetical protein